jgi:NAD(P)-dependent dehydrogenase (short-subunit alcohol dehydrogenase family)
MRCSGPPPLAGFEVIIVGRFCSDHRGELVIAELSSPESCYAAIDQAVRKFSGLDALVNNAGVNDKVG